MNTVIPEKIPHALPIIMKYDSSTDKFTHEEALIASAQHMLNLLSHINSVDVDEPVWGVPWSEWQGGQFRKIVKRAKTNQFNKYLEQNDGVHVTTTTTFTNGKTMVLSSIPPYLVTERPPSIKNFQVSGLEFPHDGVSPTIVSAPGSVPAQPRETMGPRLALHQLVESISTGKMVAQVGHAVQLIVNQTPAHVLQGWKNSGSVIVLEDFVDSPRTVKVIDAGFTELPPRTATIKSGFKDILWVK